MGKATGSLESHEGVYPEAFQQGAVGSVGSVGSVRNAGRKGSTRARVEAPFVGSVVSVGIPVASHTPNSVSNTPPSPLTWESNTSNTSNSSPISVGNDEDFTEALLAKVRRGDWLSHPEAAGGLPTLRRHRKAAAPGARGGCAASRPADNPRSASSYRFYRERVVFRTCKNSLTCGFTAGGCPRPEAPEGGCAASRPGRDRQA